MDFFKGNLENKREIFKTRVNFKKKIMFNFIYFFWQFPFKNIKKIFKVVLMNKREFFF